MQFLIFSLVRILRAGSHVSDDEIRQAEEKFAESLHLAQLGMFNLLENDVSVVINNTLIFFIYLIFVCI